MKIPLIITCYLLFFSSCIRVSNTNSFLSQDFKGYFNNVLIVTETNDNLNLSSVAKELNANFKQKNINSDLSSIASFDGSFPAELDNLNENIKYILVMQRFGENAGEVNIALKLFEKATKNQVWNSQIEVKSVLSNSDISFVTSQIVSLMDKDRIFASN